jgi:hypothetical protein
MIEVYPILSVTFDFGMNFYRGGNTSGGSTLDDPAKALANAINKTGVQAVGNPCSLALWYAGSAGGAVLVSSTTAGGALFPETNEAINAFRVWYSLQNDQVRATLRQAGWAAAYVSAKVMQGCSSLQ